MKRTLQNIVTVLLIAFLLVVKQNGVAQLPGYALHKVITIQNEQVIGTGVHSDFPVLISHTDPDLRSSANFGNVKNSNRYAIDASADVLYAVGPCENAATFYGIPTEATNNSTINTFLASYRFSDGGLKWLVEAKSSGDDMLSSQPMQNSGMSVTTFDDSIYVFGCHGGNTMEFVGGTRTLLGAPTLADLNGGSDLFYCAADATGSIVSAQRIDNVGSTDHLGTGIAANCEGVSLSGMVHDGAIFPGPDVVSTTNHSKPFLAQARPGEGAEVWLKAYDGPSGGHQEIMHDVTADNFGNIYTVGTFANDVSLAGDTTLLGSSDLDVMTYKCRSDGIFIWGQRSTGSTDDMGSAIATNGKDLVFEPGENSDDFELYPQVNATTVNDRNFFLGGLTADGSGALLTCCPEPSAPLAGTDQLGATMCGLTSTTLVGNIPGNGIGTWTIISGVGGTIATPTAFNSNFDGVSGTTYVLRWSISNTIACPTSTDVFDEVSITFEQGPATAAAGTEQIAAAMCGIISTTLAGNNATIGTGAWSIISGVGWTVVTPAAFNSVLNGIARTTYVLRGTISNAPCVPSTDDVPITFSENPSTAAAGADQVGAAMCGLTSATLDANSPTVGTGSWSIISGAGGTVVTPAAFNSVFNGIAGTTYVLRWTIIDAPSLPSTDDVTITFQENPSTAVAGIDQSGALMCGITSTTLAANNPTIGTGAWSIISGAGGTVVTPGAFNAVFNGITGTTYVLRWTISNPPCGTSADDVTITFQEEPTVSVAGPNQSPCGASATLAANTPLVGTGAWSIVSGAGGAVVTPGAFNAVFNGITGTTYVLRWTISNPPCGTSTSEVTITFRENPSVAAAGADQIGAAMCGSTSTTLAGNTPTIGTGLWSIISGAGGTVVIANASNSLFNGMAGATYVLRWTISNAPCGTSTDDVTITFQEEPTVSVAGPNQSQCGSSATLAANTPLVGTGAWSIVSGAGGAVVTPGAFNSVFNGIAGTTYVLRWTISNPPCGTSTSEVTMTFRENPSAAAAGADQIGAAMCGLTSTTLAGNSPAVGTGVWSIISGTGGVVFIANAPSSTFNGTAGTTYVLRWTITNAPCGTSTDDVTITFQEEPTAAVAGLNQSQCGTNATMDANTPLIGSGAWTLISGTGIITTPASPTSGITGLGLGPNVFEWTISNTPCVASSSQVTITIAGTITASDAGVDQFGTAMCGLTSTTLAGNVALAGTGSWSIVSGVGGTINAPASNVSTFDGVAGTTYVLEWAIVSPPCAPSFDSVSITFEENPTTSTAGANQIGTPMCGLSSTTLGGNTPAVGTGLWTIVSGVGGTINNPTSNTSAFDGVAGTTYVLEWTISTVLCGSSVDNAIVTFQVDPSISAAGSDQIGAAMCGITSTTLGANVPTIGTGLWTIVSGAGGTINTPTSNMSTFDGVAGTTYVLEWAISNAPCAASLDNVIITFQEDPTVSAAGADQVGAAMCGLATTSLTGNVPTAGTGLWTIISGAGGTINTPTSNASAFDGVAGTTYVLEWAITNALCGNSLDSVTITFQENPTASAAGADQIGAAMCGITSTTLAANIPAVGTALWTIVSGVGGTINTPTNNASTFDGIAGTTYVLEWAVTSAPCPVSLDSVTITFQQYPSAATAGGDQIGAVMCGLISTTFAANTPTVGTGLWTIVSGAGGIVNTPTSNVSTFNGVAGTTYVLEWSITSAPCGSSLDSLTITFEENPTVSSAGPDQIGNAMCGLTSTTLVGNNPIVGTGAWSIISGTGGVIAAPSAYNSSFSGVGGQTYLLEWSVSNPPCTISLDTVIITFEIMDDPAFSYVSKICQTAGNPFPLAITTPGGSFNDPSGVVIFADSLTGEIDIASTPAGTYVIEYVTNGLCADSSIFPITIVGDIDSSWTTPPTMCAAATAINLRSFVTGTPGGIFTGIGMLNDSVFDPANAGVGSHIVTYTVGPHPCTESLTLTIIVLANAVADAGLGGEVCELDFSLSAFSSPLGAGTWSGPGTFSPSVNDSLAAVTADGYGAQTFYWTVEQSGICSAVDSVTITFDETPIADAGADQVLSFSSATYLDAAIPNAGSGFWTVITTGPNVFDLHDETSQVDGLIFGENEFVWTVMNGVCPDAYDTVIISADDLFIPEAITPNFDGKNDYLVIAGIENVPNSIQILNRWGQEVFYAIDYQNDWYGLSGSGAELGADTYFYILEIGEQKYNGFIVIRR